MFFRIGENQFAKPVLPEKFKAAGVSSVLDPVQKPDGHFGPVVRQFAEWDRSLCLSGALIAISTRGTGKRVGPLVPN